MIANFDQVLFLISTDFFCPILFDEFLPKDIEAVKKIAREEILSILNGSDNYYMCADFSSRRREKTTHNFFAKSQVQGVAPSIQRKINSFNDALVEISTTVNTAMHEISHIASGLYWLQTEEFITPIPDEILDCVAMVESIGLSGDQCEYVDWEDLWLKSPSDWDKFLMSIMDGIPETPSTTFYELTKLPSQLDFLHLWKARLGENRFAVLKEYIRIEAHAQLEEINPDSASEIAGILEMY
jgi:hypothetical protein